MGFVEYDQLFQENVLNYPHTVAMVEDDGKEYTFAMIEREVVLLASRLSQLGVGPGTRVALIMPRSAEYFITVLSIIRLKGTFVPIDLIMPPERVQFMVQQAHCTLLLTVPGVQNTFPDLIQLGLVIYEITLGDTSPFPNPSKKVEHSHASISEDELTMVIVFTSGSTGMPKGVLHSYRGITKTVLKMAQQQISEAPEVILCRTCVGFTVGLADFLPCLISRSKLVIARSGCEADLGYLCDLCERFGVTSVHFTTTYLQRFLVWLSYHNRADRLPLKTIRTSGEPIRPHDINPIWQVFKKPIKLVLIYGTTEVFEVSTENWFTQPYLDGPALPLCKLSDAKDVYVLDEKGNPVSNGFIGEVYLGGPGVAQSCLSSVQSDHERLLPNPFGPGRLFRTGDLVKINEKGEIEFLGRKDHMIKVQGFRFYPAELESLIGQVDIDPPIETIVISTYVASNGNTLLIAYISPDTIDVKKLKSQLRQKLPSFLIPHVFVLLNTIPTNQHGKIDRGQLPLPVYQQKSGKEFPQTVEVQKLKEIWSDLLKVKELDIRDDFFALGGDDILGALMIERAKNLKLIHSDLDTLIDHSIFEDYLQANGLACS